LWVPEKAEKLEFPDGFDILFKTRHGREGRWMSGRLRQVPHLKERNPNE
jgi:hypothetical protein